MPIKPENKHRYPANWKEIRAGILQRANHRCEWEGCGAMNRAIGIWKRGEFFMLAMDKSTFDPRQEIHHGKVITIVLTIAHLDHTPEHNDPSNLMAMCQRHHLAYDAEHHKTNSYMTRKAKAQTQELPL